MTRPTLSAATKAEPAKALPEADTLDASFHPGKPFITEPHRTRYRCFRSNSALAVGAILLAAAALAPKPKPVFAAPRYTQPAQQCVDAVPYPAGTNNYPYPFTRFYNRCNQTISLMLTTQSYANNGPGTPGPGAFMVMAWVDGVPRPVHTFACVYPGEPVKPGSTFENIPSFDDAGYECLVP